MNRNGKRLKLKKICNFNVNSKYPADDHCSSMSFMSNSVFTSAVVRSNGERVKTTNTFRTVLEVRNAAAVILLNSARKFVWDYN